MKQLLSFVLIALFSAGAQAAYQVEIIIFEHLYHDADGEIAQIGLKLPDLSTTVELSGADEDFRPLPSSMYKLAGVYSELKSSSGYRPILHVAWQQPQLTQSQARYVHITKADGAAQAGESSDGLVKVDGVIRIRSSTFLHADVDLFYFVEPVSASFISENAGWQSTEGIQTPVAAEFAELKETRRMKLNELHYFDHPVFGVFMRVSRLNSGE